MYFDSLMEHETGIYVVCSDKKLLETINSMLKRQGIVGVTDTVGRTHYLLDARVNPGQAAKHITDFINTNSLVCANFDCDDSENEKAVDRLTKVIIAETLRGYGFDLSLIGTKAIIVLIKILLKRDNMVSLCAKEMFLMAAEVMGQTYSQIERDIRYAIKKSSYNQYGTKSSNIVRCLVEEVRGRLYIGVRASGIDDLYDDCEGI